MPYRRVLPRDLFNESKTLKSYAQLALILHDHRDQYPISLKFIGNPRRGFVVEQDESSGDLYASNLRLRHRDGRKIALGCNYNSRSPYTMHFSTDDDAGMVFDDQGQFTAEFLQAIGLPSNATT